MYLQAVPTDIPRSTKTFEGLELAEFSLTHSSKTALAWANAIPDSEITATGYATVLNEAIARGASKAIPVPFCENAVDQAKSIPEGDWSIVVIGENPDGPFEGITLAGALSEMRNIQCFIKETDSLEDHPLDYKHGTVVVVKDAGDVVVNLDVRRISHSSEVAFKNKAVIGSSQLRMEEAKISKPIPGHPKEIADLISKRLRRFSEWRN